MTAPGMIPDAVVAHLGAPDVNYTILGRFDFASGTMRLWAGAGKLTLGGHDWLGMADPGGNRMVTISEVALPEPNVASAIRVGLTGIDGAFIESALDDSTEIEGQPAELFLQIFDGDDQPIGGPVSFDPVSYMTALSYRARGASLREISVTIEGTWSAKNFPPGARLTDVDQQRRHPGDRVCRFTGWTITEVWGPS